MANHAGHSAWRNPLLLRGAAVFVVLYALAAAWIVATNGEGPEPLRLDRTDDGIGIVVSGAVSDDEDRQALIAAVGTVTEAPLIVAKIVIDPDAEPVDTPIETATELASELRSAGS